MKKLLSLLFFSLVLMTLLLAPVGIAFADSTPPAETSNDQSSSSTVVDLSTISPVNPDLTIPQIVGLIIQVALGIVGSIALIIFVYGGFLMLISQGDATKITKGKNALIWASIGLVVIFGSYVMVSYIIGALSQQGSQTPKDESNKPLLEAE
ncbi:MAG: pilin [Candidatus Parcubacteria bacterium]|nr:pilin [Candidatus Parcubacteria bacterium]